MSDPVLVQGSYYHLLTIKSLQNTLTRTDLTDMMRSNYECVLESLQDSFKEMETEEDEKEYLT